jgi:hypothetical protein
VWRKILTVLIAVGLWHGAALGQAVPNRAGELPKLFDRLTQLAGEHPTQDDVYSKADELLWDVFPQGDSLKLELIDYVKHGDEGPRLCFAGLALIPFHDAATARPMLERALDRRTSPDIRDCFSRAAYRLLHGPPVKWYGEHDDKEFDLDSDEVLQQMLKDGDDATKSSIGHVQARVVQEYMESWSKHGKDYDYGEWVGGFMDQTFKLSGFLDLRDEPLLGPALTYPDHWIFNNMISNLDYAVNRDFMGKLTGKTIDDLTPKETEPASQAADAWWKRYLREHPDGDWRPAVVAGFRDAGYQIEKDYGSSRSRQELLRALDDKEPRIRYNAYRLLNEIYKTDFDLDLAFFSGNYNFRGGERPRDNNTADNEARLKKYWQKRLGGGTVE